MGKNCTLCFNNLPFESFYVDKTVPGGYTSACKSCRSKQISKAKTKRRLKINQPYQTNETALTNHNAKALRHLLSLENIPTKITLQQLNTLRPILGGIVPFIRNGVEHVMVYTCEGERSFNLSFNSPEMIAEYLEFHQLRVIIPENIESKTDIRSEKP